MIKLDIYTGNITFYDSIITKNDRLDILKNKMIPKEIEIWENNGDWTSYRLNEQYYILTFSFLRKNLSNIEIYIKNTDSKFSKEKLSSILEILHGNNQYEWGSVFINHDLKAGYSSIIIDYKRSLLYH